MNQNLNNNYSDEKTIDLVNLLFYVLRKWKMMVVVAVIAAIAAVGFSYVSSTKELQEQVQSEPIKLSKEAKKSYQVKVDAIEEYQKNVKEYNYYLDNSIKMKLDPNKYYSGTAAYLVSTGSNVDKLKAFTLCEDAIFDENVLAGLSEKLEDHPEVAFLREVITFSEKSYAEAGNVAAQDDHHTVVMLNVLHYEASECQVMLQYLMDTIEELQAVFASQNVQADFENITSNVNTSQNHSWVKLSEEIETGKYNAYAAIEEIEKDMSSKEEQYYEANKKGEAKPSEAMDVSAIKGSISWLYVVIGMIGAMFFVAAISALIYLFSDRIRSKAEMEDIVSLPVMTFSGEISKSGINKMLSDMEKKISGSTSDAVEMIAIMLKKFADQYETKSIFITGSQNVNDTDHVILELKKMLADEKIEINTGNSILKDSKALKDAVDCGYVVFLEKCHHSSGKDIRSEVSKVNSCGGKVMGIILEQ